MRNIKDLRFSQRMGITTISKQVQFNDMDNGLRNSLWNLVYKHILSKLSYYVKDGASSNYFCLNFVGIFF